MSSSLTEFKAVLAKNLGLARGNRFKVNFSGGIPGWSGDADHLSIMCDSVKMPTRTILTTDYSLHRHAIKVPTGYTEEDVDITFNLTQNYLAKKALDSWTSKIIDTSTYRLNYSSEYRRDITIEQLDTSDAVIYTAKLKEAYPYQVSSVEFSNESADLLQISATFAYASFEIS